MGVKNLWDILESCKKTLSLHHLQNKRVCIDLSCWVVSLQHVNKSHPRVKEKKVHLQSIFHRLRALMALNCSLIFVTDGSIPAIKLSTYRKRLNSECEVAQDEIILNKLSSLKRNQGSEFSCMIKEAKKLGLALGIPCLDGIEEGEAQCALLDSEGLCDGCFSSDSDAFLFGARTVYRDICLGDGGFVVCYEMEDIERKLGFGRNSLIALALFLGSDYSNGVHGLGRESACRIVKSIGDDFVLQQIVSEGLSFAKKPNRSNNQEKVLHYKENCSDHEVHTTGVEHNLKGEDRKLQQKDQFLQVSNAYLKPKCHPANSDAVCRVLILYPFQRIKLQHLCAQFFGWHSKVTDEYILPKVAERDLRRYANFRSTSSELGVQLPLHMIPVQCPVSTIIKHRIVQGRHCYEVSWEKSEWPKTSIVPADLVESACPEKIVQFEETKKNHQKPKPKKYETQASTAEIELKLQGLLLDINSSNNSSSLSVATPENQAFRPRVDPANKEPLLVSEAPSEIYCNKEQLLNGSRVSENVFIDLLSPSPMPQVRNVSKWSKTDVKYIDVSPLPSRVSNASKCCEANAKHIDVIDLTESETEVSP